MSLSLNLYQSMALAVAIFYFGAFLKSKISVFRTYCIPSPVIGGIIYAIVNLILYQTGVLQLSVDTTLQSVFMNVFFTSVGFTAGFGMLKKGGKSLIVFLVAVCILIGIQDVAGAALCKVFGLQPLLGLALGSMPLTVGVAAATYGLVAGNVIGNPLARRRIKKLGLSSSDAAQVDHEALLELKKNTEGTAKLDVDRGTLALALIFLACGLGTLISMLFAKFNITLASYVGSMIIGIIIRNAICDKFDLDLPVQEIETIGSISLNFFLALAMMGMQLWQLADLAGPMVAILLIQTVLTGLFVYFVTFNMMGRDYDAAVLSAGHCGFGMGATPNAMANMDALTKVFGPSEKAYLIIPVCGGFFTDIVNSLILTFFMNVL